MRMLTLGMTAATAAFLLTGGVALGQTKAAPEKAQGAGAECARMTDPGKRDECVHQQNQQRSGSSSTTGSRSGSTSGSSTTNTGPNTTGTTGPNTTTGSPSSAPSGGGAGGMGGRR